MIMTPLLTDTFRWQDSVLAALSLEDDSVTNVGRITLEIRTCSVSVSEHVFHPFSVETASFFKYKLILFTSQLVTVTWKELNAQHVTLKLASVSVGSESPVFFAMSVRLDMTPHSQPARSATPATPSGQQMSKMFIEPPRCWKVWSPTLRVACGLKTIASCNG